MTFDLLFFWAFLGKPHVHGSVNMLDFQPHFHSHAVLNINLLNKLHRKLDM